MSGFLDAIGYVLPGASKKSFVALAEVEIGFDYLASVLDVVKVELKASFIEKEGIKNVVYLDTRGFPTVGIGHKIVSGDKLKIGDKISDAQIEKFWIADSSKALNAAWAQAEQLKAQNSIDFVLALCHVNFQLGVYWYTKFPQTWNLLKARDWQKAIANLENSAWNQQTPERVGAFQTAIANFYNTFG